MILSVQDHYSLISKKAMTRDDIEDYLYFFWAPLLKANAVGVSEIDDFQKMIILTMSQASVYIEAPAYISLNSSREYPDKIKNEVSDFTDKIVAEMPARSGEDFYWLKITVSDMLTSKLVIGDTHLQAEQSFGTYNIEKDKFIVFDFYYLAHQLLIRLPTTTEISAIISTRSPLTTADGPITGLEITDCTLWLSALDFDQSAAETSIYTGLRLKRCRISFDTGFIKSGNLISPGILEEFVGFVITSNPDNGISPNASDTVAARNTILYPDEMVFAFKHRPGLPQSPKITLANADPFSATLFGSIITTLPVNNNSGIWQADKNMISFALQTEDSSFAVTENESPVFNLKGNGQIVNPTWDISAVSTDHPLGFERLGLSLESGYIGFDVDGEFLLSWNGLQNKPLTTKQVFVRTSPEILRLTYNSLPSMLSKQELKLWSTDEKTGHSAIELSFAAEGNGSFISHRKNIEFHTFNASVDVNVDRPLLTNGERIFLKTLGGIALINENSEIIVAAFGGKMEPSVAFEDYAFKSIRSFALSNALILVNPADTFWLIGKLNDLGFVETGECLIKFPIVTIEHTLPDPYITSLFNDQPVRGNDSDITRWLRNTVRWNESEDPELIMELDDETGNVFLPKGLLTDEQFADRLLLFPVPHPGMEVYEQLLSNALAISGNGALQIFRDQTPFGTYQSSYHSKTNTTGAFSTLHILPGDVSLVDVSGRASQMGVAFSRRLSTTENGIDSVLENTGYRMNQTFRIENNELVSSGRFVRAFTLPHVQWEPVYFKEDNDRQILFNENDPFPTHGVPTRISSANKADVALAPIPVANYIVDGFLDEKNQFAAAAHFAMPFGMNAVTLFHPRVEGVEPPPQNPPSVNRIIPTDPYSYSILNFNQPDFKLKKWSLSGAIQIKALSEGYSEIPRDVLLLPDPSFHGAILQMPNLFKDVKIEVVDGRRMIHYSDDSILGDKITKQFNRVMWGEYIVSPDDNILNFRRSREAKVPLRRIDFSGFGASIFSNWLNKNATAGDVSQVKFNILIGRVAHEVIQIKSVIIPHFVPVVRTLIIERKNHGKIIRTDTGWVATGPGKFHKGYVFHPGITKGIYNVTSIRDTEISLSLTLQSRPAEMSGVYFDGDIVLENVVKGNKSTAEPVTDNYRLVPSKKQFGYILLGNSEGKKLEDYFLDVDLQTFMSRPEVGPLGGPVDCIVNIAGSDQMMHLTRVDVTAVSTAKCSVVAGKGTLQLPKGGSWAVVKKVTNGATLPLTNDETVPLIRNGELIFDADGNPGSIDFKNSKHVLGNPLEIKKYAAASSDLADTEYALLQSTDTQKMLFPRPSFNSNNNAVITDGITEGEKKIFITDPLLADPYSLLKSNAIFPDGQDALTLGNVPGFVKSLNIELDTSGISFPDDVKDALKDFIPHECKVLPGGTSRKLFLVNEASFKIFIDYGGKDSPNQLFTAALNTAANDAPWQMINKEVAIVVELGDFKPLLTVKGNFTAEPGAKPKFENAKIAWGDDENLQKIIQVLSILSMLSKEGDAGDIIANGFNFAMGNSPDSWSYKCTIEEKIPVIQFPNPVQLAQLPVPAPLIVEAGLDLGVFFNLSLSTDPNNLIKAGAGVVLGFEATIQVLLITIEAVTAYGVGTAKVEVFIELPEAKPTFKFTMGFGATVAVQLPMVGYVSITRVISLGASIDDKVEMTVGQLLRGVLTVGGGLASVSVQVEASGTVSNKSGKEPPNTQWTATVRGVFTLDVSVAFVFSWDFSKEFEHEIDLPNPF